MDETNYVGFFATGDQTFWLPMPRIVAAEREMGCSVSQLLDDLGKHIGQLGDDVMLIGPSPATLTQCHALIANALIGGGMDEREARDLVKVYAYPARPWVPDMDLAWRILHAAAYGVKIGGSKKKAATPSRSRSTRAK